MFFNCFSLEELNLSNFNTDKVYNMTCMFQECFSLKELNIANFNTDNVVYLSNMFKKCTIELINKVKAKYKLNSKAFINYD